MTREVPDWAKKISPFVDRHLSEADKEELKKRYDGVAWERLGKAEGEEESEKMR